MWRLNFFGGIFVDVVSNPETSGPMPGAGDPIASRRLPSSLWSRRKMKTFRFELGMVGCMHVLVKE